MLQRETIQVGLTVMPAIQTMWSPAHVTATLITLYVHRMLGMQEHEAVGASNINAKSSLQGCQPEGKEKSWALCTDLYWPVRRAMSISVGRVRPVRLMASAAPSGAMAAMKLASSSWCCLHTSAMQHQTHDTVIEKKQGRGSYTMP